MDSDFATIRYADRKDLSWCLDIDQGVGKDILQRKIDSQELMIAQLDNMRIGYLRLDYLWTTVPYIGRISTLTAFQRKGVGRSLLRFLENELRDSGKSLIISSAHANEPVHHAWHRSAGFEECGILAGVHSQGVGEIFFKKALFI